MKEKEQKRFNLIREYTKPTLSLGTEKKRTVSDRPRVKRTKSIKQQTQPIQPSVQLDIKPVMQFDELHNIPIKQEPFESESSNIPYIKEEILENVPSPPPPTPLAMPLPPSPTVPSPPLSIPIPDPNEEELIKTNLNAIQLESCSSNNTDLINIKEEFMDDMPKMEPPMSLTADEIRKAEEGQAAAAMLLEQMSDIEEKYNSPSPPPPPPPPPPSHSPSENISDSKFSPPNYLGNREFHPEDMLTTCTVPSINTE